VNGQLHASAALPPGKLRMYWISSRVQPTRCGPPSWELSKGLTIPHRKRNVLHRASELKRTFVNTVMNLRVP
jgi:hypothetical protein